MSAFNAQQTEQLLRPIHPSRVLRDGKGHSHVSQQDITAHLIRVFGFGSFDTDVVNVECVFEREREDKSGAGSGRWDICYRALVRLTVRDEHGDEVCHYEDGSTATAQNQTRGDGHDLAYKSAISLSKKRAAINLGDQFGLSLYNKGQTSALVIGTLVGAEADSGGQDMQEGVPQQVSLGNDEIEHVDTTTGEITEPRKYARPVSELDAERNPDDPEAERQARLAEAKVRRDALGVDSSGKKRKGEPSAERYDATTLPAEDAWTVADA